MHSNLILCLTEITEEIDGLNKNYFIIPFNVTVQLT